MVRRAIESNEIVIETVILHQFFTLDETWVKFFLPFLLR
jgi:hypothetical protein